MQKTTDNQNELFDIVDENDNVVGRATRGEVHGNKNLIHRSVGVVIFNSSGEIFLQQRSATKDTDPNLWTISASGHVESGDSYEETAIRELQEELGLNGINGSSITDFSDTPPQSKPYIHRPISTAKLSQVLSGEVGLQNHYSRSLILKPVFKYLCRTPNETEMVMLYKAVYDGLFKLNKEEIRQGKFFTRKKLKEAVKSGKIKLSLSGKVALGKFGWIEI